MDQDQASEDAIVVATEASTQTAPTSGSTGKRAQGKKFGCTHQGCNKRFTRMEHMQRHALNHTAVDSTCPRCNVVFKRPDLLERHMHRHEQRDAEAGGPGHGTLDTRKRAWKGPDGTVVDKRPRTDAVSTTSFDHPGLGSTGQVVSPPVSDEGRYHAYSFGGDVNEDSSLFVDGFDASTSLSNDTAGAYFSHPQYEAFPLSMTPGPNAGPEYRDESINYHPAFQPDTASSFNMPYTTALDYNWLFNLETATDSSFGLHSGNTLSNEQLVYSGDTGPAQNSLPIVHPTPLNPPSESESTGWSTLVENTPRIHAPLATPTLPPAWSAADNHDREGQTGDTLSNDMPLKSTLGTRRSHKERECADTAGRQADDSSQHDHQIIPKRLESEHPLSMLQKPDHMPQMDQETHERLLTIIDTANPQIPDQLAGTETRDNPLLSLASLQSWLDLFFNQFNTTYPLIHMSTFDPACAEPLHLLSMILLGATYSDKSAHQIAVCIHDVIRPSIFAHAGFSASPELWALQTILLVECFGKSRAGQKQHDMSHLFHGLLINLIRRSDCQSITKTPCPPPVDENASALDNAWSTWAISEQKKRLALLCFMWDTQHAVLFCQSLCMSAFELRGTLPCDQDLWEAPTAERWATIWRESSSPSTLASAPGPLFLPALKAYLIPRPKQAGPAYVAPNVLSLVLVLHGIMSVSWDMIRRDQTSLGVSKTLGVASWRTTISKAYDTWKTDFDQYCQVALARSDETIRTEWSSFHASYSAIYHAAQTLLNMEFLDVQIYAGARNILGRPVQQRDYSRSSRIVKRWATMDRERASRAAYHAAKMLSTVVAGGVRSGQGTAEAGGSTDTNLFHVPWCLYLATLTCWAFHHAKPARGERDEDSRNRQERESDASGDESDSSDEIVWDTYKEMEALLKAMVGSGGSDTAAHGLLSVQGRKGTNGLVWVVADVLSRVRWGIVHAGVSVLRGLVPARLISQYEIA